MKRFIKSIYKLFGIHRIITELQEEESINKCINSSTGGKYYPESRVINLQNNSNNIVIGINSHIRGELLVFPYGGKIKIGKNCFIGENSRIWSGEEIIIGNDVLISHNVNIIDTNTHEIDPTERSLGFISLTSKGHPDEKGTILTSKIEIGDNVWINFNSIILKGVKIGSGSIIGAGSVVTSDIPENSFVAGTPARIINKLNQ
jgi:Acetyltransferase (isoleucine patch superfamily)